MSGEGTVYSFTIVSRPLTRWFAERVPIVVAIVSLVEGVRMMTNIVGTEPESVYIGMPVSVCWDDTDGGITLPNFSPVIANEEREVNSQLGDLGGIA